MRDVSSGLAWAGFALASLLVVAANVQFVLDGRTAPLPPLLMLAPFLLLLIARRSGPPPRA